MPDWNTRLAIEFSTDPTDATQTQITPIDSFSTTIGLAASELHSIEATHVGAVYAPKTIQFQMIFKAMGDMAATLSSLAFQGSRFDVIVQVQEGTDWAFQKVLLKNCIVTQFITNAPVTGAPTITLNGVSLSATETPANSSLPPVTIPF